MGTWRFAIGDWDYHCIYPIAIADRQEIDIQSSLFGNKEI